MPAKRPKTRSTAFVARPAQQEWELGYEWSLNHAVELGQLGGNWVALGRQGVIDHAKKFSQLQAKLKRRGISRPLFTWVDEKVSDDEVVWPGLF